MIELSLIDSIFLVLALVSIVFNIIQFIKSKIADKSAQWFVNQIYSHAFTASVNLHHIVEDEKVKLDVNVMKQAAKAKSGVDGMLEACGAYSFLLVNNAPIRIENWQHRSIKIVPDFMKSAVSSDNGDDKQA